MRRGGGRSGGRESGLGVPLQLQPGTLTRLPERLSPSRATRDPAQPSVFIRPENRAAKSSREQVPQWQALQPRLWAAGWGRCLEEGTGGPGQLNKGPHLGVADDQGCGHLTRRSWSCPPAVDAGARVRVGRVGECCQAWVEAGGLEGLAGQQ